MYNVLCKTVILCGKIDLNQSFIHVMKHSKQCFGHKLKENIASQAIHPHSSHWKWSISEAVREMTKFSYMM